MPREGMSGWDAVVDLLKQSSVQVHGAAVGTGFFVTPDLIVTCAHVVGTNAQKGTKVDVCPRGEGVPLSADVVEILPGPHEDVAVLKLTAEDLKDAAVSSVPAACDVYPLLDDDGVSRDDELLVFGFPKYFPGEAQRTDSLNVTYAAKTGFTDDPEHKFHKFTGDRVVGGFSGSPVLSLRTGRVLGIVDETLDPKGAAGGWAVPASFVLKRFPALAEANRQCAHAEPWLERINAWRQWQHIYASGPSQISIEILEDGTSPLIDKILLDVKNVVLRHKPEARVLLANGTLGVVRDVPAIIRAVRTALGTPRRSARRLLEWSAEFEGGNRISVFITSVGGAVFLYSLHEAPNRYTNDLIRSDWKTLIQGQEPFTAFPSIYDDIVTNLKLHAGGGLQPQLYLSGLRQCDVPVELLGNERALVLFVEKATGTEQSLKISEVSVGRGRVAIALGESLAGVVNPLWLLPLQPCDTFLPLLDFLAVFFYEYNVAKTLSREHLDVVIQHLEGTARQINSSALSGGGVFESLLTEIRARAAAGTKKRGTRRPAKNRPAPKTTDEFVARVREEFELVTGVDLTQHEVEQEDEADYSRLMFSMTFEPDAVPQHQGPKSSSVEHLMVALGAHVAKGSGRSPSDVYSVRYRPFMFTDAVALIVKVNWRWYKGEEDIELFDV